MREILTLQLGHLSNYTATHFWNAQESYFTYSNDEESWIDHNVHWRPGIGADGSETFLPRTVIYDLKGGFGSLRKINALYEPEADPTQSIAASSLWSGQSSLQKQTPIEQSAYQRSLDDGTQPPPLTPSSVRYWSDFSRVYHHPKSLVQLYDFELHSSIRPFENHDMGAELFSSLDKDEDIVDRDFRPFAEESDQMQGIQVVTTLDDAWGGFAGKYLDALRDEYPKTCIWLWGLQTPMAGVPREKRRLRAANTAQALARACSTASMVVPLALPEGRMPRNVAVDTASPWHVSAAFATALETATLESRAAVRRGTQPATLWDMAEGLNTGGNQTLSRMRMSVGSMAAERDTPDSGDVDFFSIGRVEGGRERSGRGKVFGQLSSSHGRDSGEEEKKGDEEDERDPRARRLVGEPVYQSFDSPTKFPLLDSFPSIYPEGAGRPDIEVRTVLSTESSIARRIKAFKSLSAWSIPLDEREALSNDLAEIGDAYEGDWSEGSDEDDDDA